MKFSTLFSALALSTLPSTILASTQSVAYDTVYDNSSGSLATVTCSDGSNGLLTRGFTTFGSLPSFPNVGASFAVNRTNPSGCGTCWNLTYANAQGVQKSIIVTAIDAATSGFVVGLTALNTLTGGLGEQLGRTDVDAVQVLAFNCGL